MRREQKILLTIIWGLAVMMMLGFVAVGLQAKGLYDIPRFSLTDQTGHVVSDSSLRGNVWIATLFFTQCPGICPMMSARMAELQRNIPQKDVKIVSFSLDPEHDTPQILRAYADRFSADAGRWHMLMGDKQTMYDLARALKLPAEPAHDGQPILHSQKVLLVDRESHVRGVYDTNDEQSMTQLAADTKTVAQE